MPNYTAEYNGRKVTLTGDTPPTEKDFDAAFAQIDKQSSDGGEPINANNGVVSGGVQENALLDSAKGLTSGLTEIPRAIGKFTSPIVNPIVNAITYPISQGINTIKGKPTQSFRDYNTQQNNIQSQLNQGYKPKTGWGKTSKFIGSLLPYLPIKGGKLAVDGLTGAIQGGTSAINNNENPALGALQGAGISMATNGLLKGGGLAYEKGILPFGSMMSGVEQKNAQRALEAYKQGRSVFSKNVNQDELNKLGEIVGQEARNLDGQGSIPYNEVQNDIQDILSGYSTSGEINPVADAIKPQTNKFIQKYLDKYKPKVGETITMPDGQKITREEFNQLFDGMQPEDLHFSNTITKEGGDVPPSVLHDIKEAIYDNVKYDKKVGFKRTDRENGALKKIAKSQNQRLRDLSSEYAQANDNYSQMVNDLKAKEDFSNILKYKSPYIMARMGAPLVGAKASHNPLLMGFEFLTSPKLNQYGLQLYNQGTKIAPYLPRLITIGTTQK